MSSKVSEFSMASELNVSSVWPASFNSKCQSIDIKSCILASAKRAVLTL